MSHLLDDDDDDLQGRANEREITLSTSSVLGIFFGLALLCALFFGFGYNMGHKSVKPPIAATDNSGNPASTTDFSAFKPAAGSPESATPPGAPATTATAAPAGTASGSVVSTPAVATSHPSPNVSPSPATAPASAQPAAGQPSAVAPAAPNHAAPASATEPAGAGSFVVQIAAVSHQEDADLLVGALKQRGYSVTAHIEPQDRLIHIQVGPFNNRKDADAMRQRLLTDGYNAIVK